MKRRQQPEPNFTTDAHGQELAHVALANTDKRATLYAEDYRRLMDAGFTRYWALNGDGHGNAYVMLNGYTPNGRCGPSPVARFIVDASKGRTVKYADGDRLNLRRENLVIGRGPAKMPAASITPRRGGAHSAPGKPTEGHAGDAMPTPAAPPQRLAEAATEPLEQAVNTVSRAVDRGVLLTRSPATVGRQVTGNV